MSFQIENINDLDQTLFIESILLKDINKKVCIMYLDKGYAAERSYRIQDIVNIYSKETTSSLLLCTIEIS